MNEITFSQNYLRFNVFGGGITAVLLADNQH